MSVCNGKKEFSTVLKTYAYSFLKAAWLKKAHQHERVCAYDLTYNNTKRSDFTNVSEEVSALIDRISFIGKTYMQNEIGMLISRGVIDEHSAKLLFTTVMPENETPSYTRPLKQGMDALLFLDDDEYPLAVTKTRAYPVWTARGLGNPSGIY